MTGDSRGVRPGSTPVVELGLQLKAERERARPGRPRGYAKSEIPKNIITDRTLLNIEEGRNRTVKRGFVRDICAFYQTGPELIENLVQLADATYMDEWTDAYAAVVDKDAWLYQQREDRASDLRFHDSNFIPSMVQPPSYLGMIRSTTRINVEQPEIDWDQAHQFRSDRQQRWRKSERRTTCLIGETAFLVDLGAAVNDELRGWMLELAQLPFVDIRVVPFSSGRYDLMGWELNMLEFENGDEPLIRARSARGSGFIPVNSHRGRFFRQSFDHALELSIPVEEYLS